MKPIANADKEILVVNISNALQGAGDAALSEMQAVLYVALLMFYGTAFNESHTVMRGLLGKHTKEMRKRALTALNGLAKKIKDPEHTQMIDDDRVLLIDEIERVLQKMEDTGAPITKVEAALLLTLLVLKGSTVDEALAAMYDSLEKAKGVDQESDDHYSGIA